MGRENRRLALFGKARVIALHPVRRVLHHGFTGMRVDIERERRGCVSHERLHRLDVRAGRDRNCRAGVPQIVGTKIRSTDSGGKALEVPAESLNDEIAAQLICKNQIVRIAPHLPGAKPVLRLPDPLGSEIVKRDGRRFYDAHFAALGAAYDGVGAALRFGLLQLLADGKPLSLKIHTVPAEPQTLAFTKPRKQTQRVCVAIGMRVNGAQKERDFPVGQGMNFRARDLRCFGCVARIGSQIPLLDGNREGLVQNGRSILDGLRRLPGGLHTLYSF